MKSKTLGINANSARGSVVTDFENRVLTAINESDSTTLRYYLADPITFRQVLYANQAWAGELLELLGKKHLEKLMPDFIDFNTTLSMLPSDYLKLALCQMQGKEWVKNKLPTADTLIAILSNYKFLKPFSLFCQLVGINHLSTLLSDGISLLKFLLLLDPAHRESFFYEICGSKPDANIKNGCQLYNVLLVLPVTCRETIAKSCSLQLQESLGLFLATRPYQVKIQFCKDNNYFTDLAQPHVLLQQRIVEVIKNYSRVNPQGKDLWHLTSLLEETKLAIEAAHKNCLSHPEKTPEYHAHAFQFIVKRLEILFIDLQNHKRGTFNFFKHENQLVIKLNKHTKDFHCERLLANTLCQTYRMLGEYLEKDPRTQLLATQVSQIEPLPSYKFSTLNLPIVKRKVIKSEVEMENLALSPSN